MSSLGIDPHPYDMPPAERAAYANGYGQGTREAAETIAALRAELAVATEYGLIQWRKKVLAQIDADRLRAAARRDAETIARLKEALEPFEEVLTMLEETHDVKGRPPDYRVAIGVGLLRQARTALMDTPRQPSSDPDP